jgi:LysM repeat protein
MSHTRRLAIRVWLLLMIVIASSVGAPALAQGATVVGVDPSVSSVQVNNIVNISIKVDNITNLVAFEIHLSFDPHVLEVTGMTNGGFVPADFTAQNVFDNVAGTIDYAVAQVNRPPSQGSGALLNIAFRAKENGSSTLTTRATQAAPTGLLLADQDGTGIQASWAPGTVNVETPQATTVTPTFTPTPTNTPTPTSTAPTSTPGSVTPTLTSTPTRTPTTTPPSGTLGIHVVRWGEWLYCIARAYKASPWAIAKENNILWPYIIFPNQKLTIPNVPWTNMTTGPVCKAQFTSSTPPPTSTPATPVTPVPTTVTPIPATTAPPSACRATYVVRQGDTLYNIALRYGTTYTEIARVNHISNPRLIYPGQQLCIP